MEKENETDRQGKQFLWPFPFPFPPLHWTSSPFPIPPSPFLAYCSYLSQHSPPSRAVHTQHGAGDGHHALRLLEHHERGRGRLHHEVVGLRRSQVPVGAQRLAHGLHGLVEQHRVRGLHQHTVHVAARIRESAHRRVEGRDRGLV